MIYKDESLEYLLSLNTHCIREDYAQYLNGIDIKPMDHKPEIKKHKLGIIVPNYNNGEWLERSLGSLLYQTYKNFEIIFIDDMSTDNSIEIAKRLLRPQDKIVELKQKRYNGGARNEGYLHLSEDVEYVYYLDSDDWLTNEHSLETINDNLNGSPDVLFVGVGADYNGVLRCFYNHIYQDRYEAILGWSGCYGKVIKKELAMRCLFPEGTLKEDRTQHYKVCLEMTSYKCIQDLIYVWNRNNTHSVTTERTQKWKTDTIRNWADSIDIYEKYKGKDNKIDQLLLARIENCKMEVDRKGDEQR